MLLLHLRYTYAISSRHRFPLCCGHLEPKYQPISQPETPHVITSFQSSRLTIHGFKRRTLTCAESNAYITNTLNKLIFTQSSARFLFLSCVHSLFWSVRTKWREEREEMCYPFFKSTKYTLMRIHFCVRCSVFENDESVNGLESRHFGGVLLVMLLRENENGNDNEVNP